MANKHPARTLHLTVGLAAGLLALGGGPAAAVTAQADYIVRSWTAEEGLPENTVSALLQTRDGYLWVGSYVGLARFDGVNFTVFNNSNVPELRDNAVTSLFEGDDGTLWIGHETGALTCYRDGRFEPVRIPSTVEPGKIAAIASDDVGAVWVMSQGGLLARVQDGSVVGAFPGSATNLVALTRSPKGTIWVIQNGVISELSHGQLKVVEGLAQPAQGSVQGVCASRDGGLWVGSEGKLRKWKDGRWVEDLGDAPWGTASVYSLLETRAGHLAAATPERGFFLVDPEKPSRFAHFCRTNGFGTDWIVSVCEDHEGGIWVGVGGAGLRLLREKRVETLSPPDQWQGRVVQSVSPGRDGSLWIGTEGAGLYHYRNGTWENFGPQQNLHAYVWSAVEDLAGTLWVGTWGAGLYALRNGQIEAVPITEGATPPICAILCSRQGGLWVGTEAGLLRYDAGRTTWYRHSANGEPLRRIRSLVEDPAGGVWFGSMGGGLGCVTGGAIRQYRQADGLASDFVECLYRDREGVLWIGTQGAGLCRFKQGRFASVDQRQGLFSGRISDIKQDDEGFFWLSSRDGIMRVPKAELDRCLDEKTNELPCVVYGPWDGMPTVTCSGKLQPAGARTPDGRLLFPTTKGLVIVDPQVAKPRPSPPPVVIERLTVEDRVAAEGAALSLPIRIPPGRYRLEFEYTGLSFVAPERVRFRYRLEGLESQWVDAGTKRIANYSHIPPGDYVFHVTACSSDGIWNTTGASVAFYVAPYFWQTWWFRVLGAVGLVAGTGGIFWVVGRRRLRRKLEQIERRRAIEQERSRIARDIHDDLGAHLTRITMLSESAQRPVGRPEQVLAGLSQIYDTAQELTRSMDEIVWAVNPKHDTLEGLANYLEKFALDFLRPAGIACQLDFPIQFPGWSLTSEVRHNLFLAFKEALNNLVKHAAATEVTISLRVETGQFELIVQDNGRGFAPEAITSQSRESGRFATGNGLDNLQRRLEKAGGICQIVSTPGRGTQVLFRVPVG